MAGVNVAVQAVGVQSVGRAFALLEAVGDEPSSLTELARRVELPISTASRLLSTLESLGAIERLDDVGLFRIGPSILKMASSVDSSTSLAALALPELETLSDASGESSGLCVPAGYTAVYLTQIDPGRSVQIRDWVGVRIPMHLSSGGLVLLAHWPADAVDNFLERGLPSNTTRSVTDPARIRERLVEIREVGHAWTIEEFEVGVSSCSAPVFNASGEAVASLSLHGPSYRYPKDDRPRFEALVKGAARRIADVLGPQS